MAEEKMWYLQKKFKDCPTQLSAGWLEGRRFNFGGSEISTVLGKNKYLTLDEMISNKVNKENIRNNCTSWGYLFEPIAKHFLSTSLNIKIEQFGSIPHPKYPISYSPDGVFVQNDKLRLLEIKCPIWRGIDKIPEQYLLQVKTGMDVLPVDDCLFAQFKFRKCAIWCDSKSSDYDRMFHKEPFKRCPRTTPTDFGYIWWDADCHLIDLGNKTDVHLHPKDIQPQYIYNQNIYRDKGYVLKWKLFGVKTFDISPDETFLIKHKLELWEKYKCLYDKMHV